MLEGSSNQATDGPLGTFNESWWFACACYPISILLPFLTKLYHYVLKLSSYYSSLWFGQLTVSNLVIFTETCNSGHVGGVIRL